MENNYEETEEYYQDRAMEADYEESAEEAALNDAYEDNYIQDHQSALSSAGMGTDEDYGRYADEMPDDDYFGYGSGDY